MFGPEGGCGSSAVCWGFGRTLWRARVLCLLSLKPSEKMRDWHTRLANAIPSYKNIVFADLELEGSMAQDLLLADGDAEVFDDNLAFISLRLSSTNHASWHTSLSAEPSIASLWNRLCCAVMWSIFIQCNRRLVRGF